MVTINHPSKQKLKAPKNLSKVHECFAQKDSRNLETTLEPSKFGPFRLSLKYFDKFRAFIVEIFCIETNYIPVT